MAKRKIVVEPDDVLKRKARLQVKFDSDLKTLAEDMLETMHEANGVGLAAPQLGILRRIFTMNACALDVEECDQPAELKLNYQDEKLALAKQTAPGDTNVELFSEDIARVEDDKDYVLINPEIIAKRGCQYEAEGCLSVPGIYGNVYRPYEVIVEYSDLEGQRQRLCGKGLQAACICHETDHLNGVMFYNRVPEDLYRVVEQEIQFISPEERHSLGF